MSEASGNLLGVHFGHSGGKGVMGTNNGNGIGGLGGQRVRQVQDCAIGGIGEICGEGWPTNSLGPLWNSVARAGMKKPDHNSPAPTQGQLP